MIKSKLTAFEIAEVLKSIYNRNSNEVMRFLTENGYQINEVLGVLKILYNLSVFQATALLKELNLKVSQIVTELINQNYTFDEVITLLKDHFNYSPEETATVLKLLNISIENFVDELKNIYNLTDKQLVATLNNVSYQLDVILNLLLDHFKLSIQKIVDIMVSLNFDRCDILTFFKIPC